MTTLSSRALRSSHGRKNRPKTDVWLEFSEGTSSLLRNELEVRTVTVPTSLYGSLAGAASIFIGIIAALLVNRVISSENERTQLNQRVAQINSQRLAMHERRDEIDERLEALFDSSLKDQINQRANQDLDEFLEEHQNEDFDINDDNNRYFAILDEFRTCIDEDDWSEWHYTNALIERFSEVLEELDIQGTSGYTTLEWEIRKLRDSIEETNRHLIQDHRITDRRALNQNLRELEQLYDWISSRYSSLDVSQHEASLKVLIKSLVASVVVPLIFYTLHVVGPVITSSPLLAGVEVLSVLLVWIGGLALVISHIHSEIQKETQDEIEDLYEVQVDTFAESLPNLVEIPENISPHQREEYVQEQMKSQETVRYVNESEQDSGDT